jgi:hypothetical protein
MVRIHDHYAPADFMVLDMGEEDIPIILGRPFSTSPTLSSTSDLYKALGGDADHHNTRRINLQRINGNKMKNLKKL